MKNMSSSQIWRQQHISKMLGHGQQKGGNVNVTKKKQLEEHFETNCYLATGQ